MSNIISYTEAEVFFNEAESQGIDASAVFQKHGVDKVNIQISDDIYSRLEKMQQPHETIGDVVRRVICELEKSL